MKEISKKSLTVDEVQKKMEYYCAYQERCHKDIEKKLNDFFLIPEAKQKIISHLIAGNFLNETRFAESFARGKFRIKKWGRLRIEKELKMRQISVYNQKKAFLQINPEEYRDTFYELANRKWESLSKETTLKAKQKFISYLQYRGWESYLIFEKLTDFIPKK